MPTLATDIFHPVPTDARGFRYQFTRKHHGHDPGAAQWNPNLTLEEEFAVFNLADQHDLSDDGGWLYGVAPVEDSLRYLGTSSQQIAEFPVSRAGEAWHGYPIWPTGQSLPDSRRGERMRPEKAVFQKMQDAGLITARQRKRLWKDDHV